MFLFIINGNANTIICYWRLHNLRMMYNLYVNGLFYLLINFCITTALINSWPQSIDCSDYLFYLSAPNMRTEFWMKALWVVLIDFYIGTCISKWCKHIIYVVVKDLHIRVMFFSNGFDVIVIVVNVRFFYIRQSRRSSRENIKCFFWGFIAGACVCGVIYCDEYKLVGIVGWFLYNRLVR